VIHDWHNIYRSSSHFPTIIIDTLEFHGREQLSHSSNKGIEIFIRIITLDGHALEIATVPVDNCKINIVDRVKIDLLASLFYDLHSKFQGIFYH
jgi:hypothetical protein